MPTAIKTPPPAGDIPNWKQQFQSRFTISPTSAAILSSTCAVVLAIVITAVSTYYTHRPPPPIELPCPTPLPPLDCPTPPPCSRTRLCPEPTQLCPAPPLPKCRPCPQPSPCSETACPAKCPKSVDLSPAKQPRIATIQLDEAAITTTRVIDLVRSYPAKSPERFQVITQLVDYGIEPYVRYMSRRNQKKGKEAKLCTMCKDRYQYISCVWTNNFNQNGGNANQATLKNMAYDRAMKQWTRDYQKAAIEGSKNSDGADKTHLAYDSFLFSKTGLFASHIEANIRALNLTTADGQQCRICADFSTRPRNDMSLCLEVGG